MTTMQRPPNDTNAQSHMQHFKLYKNNYESHYMFRSEFLAADPEVLVRFPELPDFLRSSGFGAGSTQPREYN
jgi:hypothetical protein